MKNIFSWILVFCAAFTLSACGDLDREETQASDLVGKTLTLTNSLLILDLHEGNSLSKSPTAQAQGFALSLDTLSGCTGCNYYQGGNFREMLNPGTQLSVTSAYKSVPASGSINVTPVDYLVAQDAQGKAFALPQYELANITGSKEGGVRPQAMLLERLLAEYTDPLEQKPFILKVQPNWLMHGHPEYTQPYNSETVATYFNPLIASLSADSFSSLEIHPAEFFVSLKANKVALANIILHAEGLKFDIIPADGLLVGETPVTSTP